MLHATRVQEYYMKHICQRDTAIYRYVWSNIPVSTAFKTKWLCEAWPGPSRRRITGRLLHNIVKKSPLGTIYTYMSLCDPQTYMLQATDFQDNYMKHMSEGYSSLLGSISISDKTSYCKISQSLQAVSFVFRIVQLSWSLTGTSAAVTSAALLLMYLSNFKTVWLFKLPIPRLRHFAGSYDKTSYRILKRSPDQCHQIYQRAPLLRTNDYVKHAQAPRIDGSPAAAFTTSRRSRLWDLYIHILACVTLRQTCYMLLTFKTITRNTCQRDTSIYWYVWSNITVSTALKAKWLCEAWPGPSYRRITGCLLHSIGAVYLHLPSISEGLPLLIPITTHFFSTLI